MLCDNCIFSLAEYDENGCAYFCDAWNMPHIQIKPRKKKCKKYWNENQCMICNSWKIRNNNGGLWCWDCGDGYNNIEHRILLLEEIANIRNPWNSHLKNRMRYINKEEIKMLRQLQQKYLQLWNDKKSNLEGVK